MIKVLHIITGLNSGGAERMLTRLVTHPGAGQIQHSVVSLLDEGFFGPAIKAHGVALYSHGMRRGRISVLETLRLAWLIRTMKPDVVQTWLYHADLMGLIAVRLAGLRVPLAWNIRCSDIDFGRHGRALGSLVRLLAKLSSMPQAVAVNSRAGLESHKLLGYRPKRWALIPNGFDIEESPASVSERESVRSELGLGKEAIVFGIVARLDPQKDYPTFLAAASRLATRNPHAHFVLIGRGITADAPGLASNIPRTEILHRFHFLGERQDVPRLLHGLDGFVLSSAYGEGFPNAVGEAMAEGIPCIVTNVGDSADIVGKTGLVVPPADPGALANAMASFALMSESERRSLGDAARLRIRARASLPSVVAAYEALYTQLYAEHRIAPGGRECGFSVVPGDPVENNPQD